MKYCFFYDETEHNRKINYKNTEDKMSRIYHIVNYLGYLAGFACVLMIAVGVRKMKLKFVKDIVILKPNMREEK